MRVYPNPFATQLHITFDQSIAGETTLLLRDVQGRLITSEFLGYIEQGPHAFRFETPQNLLPGIYVLEISNAFHTHIAKVVRQ
jgi:hypothetical protein